jgi:hypothetical protein
VKVVLHLGVGGDVIREELKTRIVETERQQSFVPIASSQNPLAINYSCQKLFRW